MQHINVIILRKTDLPPLPHIRPVADCEITHVNIMEGGMESGATSVMFLIKTPGGAYVSAQMSGGMYQTISAALEGAEKRFKGE